MSKKKRKEKKRGPKGGIKHQPGRGHERKSGPIKTERFRRKVKKLQRQKFEEARRQWAIWDALDDELKKWRQDLKPEMPRPEHED